MFLSYQWFIQNVFLWGLGEILLKLNTITRRTLFINSAATTRLPKWYVKLKTAYFNIVIVIKNYWLGKYKLNIHFVNYIKTKKVPQKNSDVLKMRD